jgi:hypothetical protein
MNTENECKGCGSCGSKAGWQPPEKSECKTEGGHWECGLLNRAGVPEPEGLLEAVPVKEVAPGVPSPPEGFIYAGVGPLEVLNRKSNGDLAMWYEASKDWSARNNKGAGPYHYAIRAGSELAKASGLCGPDKARCAKLAKCAFVDPPFGPGAPAVTGNPRQLAITLLNSLMGYPPHTSNAAVELAVDAIIDAAVERLQKESSQ